MRRFALILWLAFGCGFWQSLYASDAVPDTISVTVINESSASNWHIFICDRADTLYSGTIVDTLRFRLPATRDFYLACVRPDTGVNGRFFIRPEYLSSGSLTVTCYDQRVVTSDALLYKVTKLHSEFSASTGRFIHDFRTSKLKAEFELLKLRVKRLRIAIDSATAGSLASHDGVEDDFLSVLKYIDNVAARWAALDGLPNRHVLTTNTMVSRLLSHQDALAVDDDAIVFESTEALRLHSIVSLNIALAASHWFELEFHGLVGRNRITLDLARLVSLLVGSRSTCEIAYALFSRSTGELGVDFQHCSEPLPTYVLELAASGTGRLCDDATKYMKQQCAALEVTSVESVSGYVSGGKVTTWSLHPDSVYVIHFWGTWCTPCLQQEASIMAVADSLGKLHCRMIHVASDAMNRKHAWDKHVAQLPKDHLFVSPDMKDNVVKALGVNSYPSYVVIGPNNRLAKRVDDYRKIIDFVSTLNK